MNLPDWMRRPSLYLARHGATDANDRGEYRGWLDEPLNDDGVAAAEEMANFFSYETLGPVACHDLLRGTQTAEIISQEYDRNPMLRPGKHPLRPGSPKRITSSELRKYIDDPEKKANDSEKSERFPAALGNDAGGIFSASGELRKSAGARDLNYPCIVATAELYGLQSSRRSGDYPAGGDRGALFQYPDGSVDMVPKLGGVISEETLS